MGKISIAVDGNNLVGYVIALEECCKYSAGAKGVRLESDKKDDRR